MPNPRIGRESHKGVEARAAKREARQRAFGAELRPLDCIENAMHNADVILRGSVNGDLDGSKAHAANGAISAFLKLMEHQISRAKVRELTERIEELEAQLHERGTA
jgi:hypothetical protein